MLIKRDLWSPENVILAAVGIGVFGWTTFHRTEPALSSVLAILVTLLFYRVGYINYQMTLLLTASYLVITKWSSIKPWTFLSFSVISYFGLLAIEDLVMVAGLDDYSGYSITFVLLKTIMGFILLANLLSVSGSSENRLAPRAGKPVSEPLARL
jgi:hypothetical protein